MCVKPRHSLCAFFGLVLLLIGCAKTEPHIGNEQASVLVDLWEVRNSPTSSRIEAMGTVVAEESVVVTAKVSALVRKIHFTDGQKVSAGAPLVDLNDREIRANLREAQANTEDARLQLQRLQSLGGDIVTEAQLDIARNALEIQQARLEAIRASQEDYQILAPFDGVLGFRRISHGALVGPGTPIVTLDTVQPLKLEFAVPEVYLPRLKVGSLVQATSPSYKGGRFVGRVVAVENRVDPLTRAVPVLARLDNQDGRLRPGMLLAVVLNNAETEAIVIPETALMQRVAGNFVFGVGADRLAELWPVTIARRDAAGVVISEGLEEGQRIVVRGQSMLQPGNLVKESRLYEYSGAGQ